jgi:hypothetical protein
MICSQCNKEFTRAHHLQKYCSTVCSDDVKKKILKKYQQSDKYRETLKKYQSSEKGLIVRKKALKKYKKSNKGKESEKRYLQSDKGKLVRKKALKKYKTKYDQSDRGREVIKEGRKKYSQSSSGKETIRKYKQSDRGKELRKKDHLKRMETDPLYKLIFNTRGRLRAFYKASNIRKTNNTFIMVGCTPEFLKQHLEKQFKPGMTWKNNTRDGWHVDHIVPISLAMSSEDVEKLSHYTNLQPMWAIDNFKKSNKII